VRGFGSGRASRVPIPAARMITCLDITSSLGKFEDLTDFDQVRVSN
jgi:hypothetical protein